MAPRFLQRITDTFWQYLSPQKPPAIDNSRDRFTPKSPRNIFPIRQITPQKRSSGWIPATPEPTPLCGKRKRSVEVHDVSKRLKSNGAEYTPLYDVFQERPRLTKSVENDFEGNTSIQDQAEDYESSEEEDEPGDTIAVNAPVQYISSDDESSFASSFSFDQGVDDTITVNVPSKEIPSNLEDISDQEGLDSLFGDEDDIVFPESDQNIADLEFESESERAAEGDATIFEPTIFEEAEEEGPMMADIRARVGSLDSDFVPRQFLLDRGWPADTIWLIQRLHQRGHEHIFPAHWIMDFRFLPEGLFLPAHARRRPFIHSLRDNDFRATNSLTRLIEMGPKIRDALTVNKASEPVIIKELQKYMQWAEWDSDNQFPNLPLIDIYWDTANADVHAMQDAMLLRLARLYQRWRDAKSTSSQPVPDWPEKQESARDVPTLYGVLISHTLVGIVTFVPGSGGDSQGYLRSVGVFDFGDGNYDVWNALALALLVLHSRDQLVERGCSDPRPWMKKRWRRTMSVDPDA